MRRLVLGGLLLALAGQAWAHKASDSYLDVTVGDERIEVRWDIALRDLDFAIGLDGDGDGAITWGEVRARLRMIRDNVMPHLRFASAGAQCAPRGERQLIDHHNDGAYAVLKFELACPPSAKDIQIHYDLLFDLDAAHRGLLRFDYRGSTQPAIFSPAHPRQTFSLGSPHPLDGFLAYGREGVWHIWMGYDHVLFLLSLLLPAVLHRRGRIWVEADDFRAAFLDVVKIVTAFTLAHSATLSLAALGSLKLPSRWVETAIAASIIVSALNNLYPVAYRQRSALALIFGLIHGLGFANVLADLGLPAGGRVLALLGFNLGVELGQLVIVSAFLPLAFSARATRAYRRLVLGLGSTAIALLAFLWFVERGFNLEILGS
ncbi:MAG: HupE/UreJ family protein [Gammaproteobacteria bacterium]